MADEDTTRIISRRAQTNLEETVATTQNFGGKVRAIENEDDDHTKIFRPSRKVDTSSTSVDSNYEVQVDPVVGWVVIVDGPGKGNALKLGFGLNSIGRDADDRVPLNFGDEEISRKSHAYLTYDPKGHKFYIQHGGGINLTYVGRVPVLQTQELVGREIINIGKTFLCFIPFCGSEFTW